MIKEIMKNKNELVLERLKEIAIDKKRHLLTTNAEEVSDGENNWDEVDYIEENLIEMIEFDLIKIDFDIGNLFNLIGKKIAIKELYSEKMWKRYLNDEDVDCDIEKHYVLECITLEIGNNEIEKLMFYITTFEEDLEGDDNE